MPSTCLVLSGIDRENPVYRDADLMPTRSVYGVDLTLTQSVYGVTVPNEYLRPVGRTAAPFVSATPEKIQNYLTLINPFDGYIWAFLLASVVTVTITLIIIDTVYASWTNTSKKDIIHQSK